MALYAKHLNFCPFHGYHLIFSVALNIFTINFFFLPLTIKICRYFRLTANLFCRFHLKVSLIETLLEGILSAFPNVPLIKSYLDPMF